MGKNMVEILQNLFVAVARIFPVSGRIEALDVKNEGTQQPAGLIQNFRGVLPAAFDGRMQAGLPCLAQKRESEIGLRERFAAGDGQAAAGSGIEHVILFHPFMMSATLRSSP